MRSQSPWKNQVSPEASGTQVFLLEQHVQEITRHKNYAAKSQVLISGIMSSPRAKRSLEEWFRKALVCSLKAWSGLVLPAEVSLPAVHLLLQQYLSSAHSFSLHPDGHFCLYPMSTPCSFSPLTTNLTWKEKKNCFSFKIFYHSDFSYYFFSDPIFILHLPILDERFGCILRASLPSTLVLQTSRFFTSPDNSSWQ